jgi:protein involved in polysaccharide export with SLBB domain
MHPVGFLPRPSGHARNMTQMTEHRFAAETIRKCKALIVAVTVAIAGCSQTAGSYGRSVDQAFPSTANADAAGTSTTMGRVPEPTGVSYFGAHGDTERLETLWQERTQTKFSDFALGPGDQITITLPDVKDLSKATVKVSATGDITLPLIGKIHASGLTEQELRDEIRRRLLKFMYDPQFQLSVKQFQSRQVAVLGAVGRPGVVTLTSASETVLEAIGQAGGPTTTAADRVILIPANPSQTTPSPQTMAAAVEMVSPGPREKRAPESYRIRPEGPETPPSQRRVSLTTAQMPPTRDSASLADFAGLNGSPVVMSLHSGAPNGSARFLNMPLRPGDVLVVPAAGRVAVLGWVNNPGSFRITSGFSVLSAVGAAGGPMFAADQTNIRLIRTTSAGTTETIPLNLEKIRRGEAPDVPVQGNDVIEVGYSAARIIPYTFYSIFNSKVWLPLPYL